MDPNAQTPVLVVGLARSGVAASRLLRRAGRTVVATDAKDLGALAPQARALADLGVTLRCGTNQGALWDAGLVVASPGVPPDAPPLAAARAAGIPVVAEVELAWRALHERCPDARTVAVTGTNGKSTVVELCGAMVRAAGLTTYVGGNVGRPLSDLAASDERVDVVVLELSSYQLELTDTLRPDVAMVLNLTPDHLERHGSMQAYADWKARIFAAMGAGGHAVLHADRAYVEAMRTPPGVARHLLADRDVDAATRTIHAGGARFTVGAPGLRGLHNLTNAAFAAHAMSCLDIPAHAIALTLQRFEGLPHRIERAGVTCGVTIWNDSKSTNVDATVRALETLAMDGAPIVLVAGGLPKAGDDPAPMAQAAARHGVRAVALTGTAAPAFQAAFTHARVPVLAADPRDFAGVAAAAAAACRRGDALLLSPACASFDQFNDFEHRGERFVSLARAALEGRTPA